jgi:hypothetical protein
MKSKVIKPAKTPHRNRQQHDRSQFRMFENEQPSRHHPKRQKQKALRDNPSWVS